MQNIDNLSQASFVSSASRFNAPKKVFVDGEMMDSEYLTKNIIFTSAIHIETPDLIKNKVHGDKTVMVRLLEIFDTELINNLNHDDPEKYIFELRALNERNNFDSEGKQTSVIGYGTYHPQEQKYEIDSEFFEEDSFYPIKLQLYINKRDGNGYVMYILPADNIAHVQYDIQTMYNFI